MGLQDIKLPSDTVTVSDGVEFSVRGLSVRDITSLAGTYGEKLSTLYAQFAQGPEQSSTEDLFQSFGVQAISAIPEVVVDVICLAADAPEMTDIVSKLRAPVQLDALDKIVRLTFQTEADIKNAVEIVIRAVNGTARVFKTLQPPR